MQAPALAGVAFGGLAALLKSSLQRPKAKAKAKIAARDDAGAAADIDIADVCNAGNGDAKQGKRGRDPGPADSETELHKMLCQWPSL